jgi:hypothetical protein
LMKNRVFLETVRHTEVTHERDGQAARADPPLD